jgi:hypothetical protein
MRRRRRHALPIVVQTGGTAAPRIMHKANKPHWTAIGPYVASVGTLPSTTLDLTRMDDADYLRSFSEGKWRNIAASTPSCRRATASANPADSETDS